MKKEEYGDFGRKTINTIEDLLKSRRHNPVFTLSCAKDMARRIRALEKKK